MTINRESLIKGYPTTFAAKRKARRFAMQGLYEWLLTNNPAHEIEARTRSENHMNKTDIFYYHELLSQTIQQNESLDEILDPAIDRELDALNVVERAILLLGVYEMRERLEIPYAVVIDEGVELAKHFGATDSHKYINGVLDKLARQLRPEEFAAGRAARKAATQPRTDSDTTDLDSL
ncbi:transcription antitermination factor NusB [Aquirhabdus parva]|uniref:Transcription antitermination protein NusB n=1 Tax=Aquirhabdus parva TaxID=2283318 RepID=A0A345P2K2_9GAMM|nr:transcription antitermination factor NusB [Aquirhabdus parva]